MVAKLSCFHVDLLMRKVSFFYALEIPFVVMIISLVGTLFVDVVVVVWFL